MKIRFAAKTHIGYSRAQNEDSHIVREPVSWLEQLERGWLFGVADGVGGSVFTEETPA